MTTRDALRLCQDGLKEKEDTIEEMYIASHKQHRCIMDLRTKIKRLKGEIKDLKQKLAECSDDLERQL